MCSSSDPSKYDHAGAGAHLRADLDSVNLRGRRSSAGLFPPLRRSSVVAALMWGYWYAGFGPIARSSPPWASSRDLPHSKTILPRWPTSASGVYGLQHADLLPALKAIPPSSTSRDRGRRQRLADGLVDPHPLIRPAIILTSFSRSSAP